MPPAAPQAGQQPAQPFGGKAPGDDEAAALWLPWAATRQAASQPDLPPEFLMRQALFASQARLLLRLHRGAELAERGLKFVRGFGALLAAQQREGAAPPLLREAWSFACHLSLAEAASRLAAARADDKRRSEQTGRGGGRCGAGLGSEASIWGMSAWMAPGQMGGSCWLQGGHWLWLLNCAPLGGVSVLHVPGTPAHLHHTVLCMLSSVS
jgi:hypothetical protein